LTDAEASNPKPNSNLPSPPQQKTVSRTTFIAAAVIILVLAVVAVGGTYYVMNTRYDTLQGSYNSLLTNYGAVESQNAALRGAALDLEGQYRSLSSIYDSLNASHLVLQSLYDSLNESCSNLQSSYWALQSLYGELDADYRAAMAGYTALNASTTALFALCRSYYSLPGSFERTLDENAVQTVTNATASATSGASSNWDAYQRVYNYIRSNVEYAYDQSIPRPTSIEYTNIGNEVYVSAYSLYMYGDIIQAPSYTLSQGQGDCDDQAILAYAMIKNYMVNYDTEYNLYIMQMDFESSSVGHVAVLLPVQGGKCCIIDPAGAYLTNSWGSIADKAASTELNAYSSYWAPQYGAISHINLYQVSVTDGSYTLFASGSISDVAAALAA